MKKELISESCQCVVPALPQTASYAFSNSWNDIVSPHSTNAMPHNSRQTLFFSQNLMGVVGDRFAFWQALAMYALTSFWSGSGAHRAMICCGVVRRYFFMYVRTHTMAARMPNVIFVNCSKAASADGVIFPRQRFPLIRMLSGLLFLIPLGTIVVT